MNGNQVVSTMFNNMTSIHMVRFIAVWERDEDPGYLSSTYHCYICLSQDAMEVFTDICCYIDPLCIDLWLCCYHIMDPQCIGRQPCFESFSEHGYALLKDTYILFIDWLHIPTCSSSPVPCHTSSFVKCFIHSLLS
jgi:hypothetical protein